MESALSIESLRVNYGPLKALTGVTFALEPGRVCGVVGMNGSGKSTLIKAIVGTVRSSGDIAVYGESARAASRPSRFLMPEPYRRDREPRRAPPGFHTRV